MILHTHQRMILSDDKYSSHQNTMEKLSPPIHQKTLNQIKDEHSGCSFTKIKNGTSHLAPLEAL